MRAARMFLDSLKTAGLLDQTTRVQTELFGSLGATGRGHGSDKAMILGLMGETPEHTDTTTVNDRVLAVRQHGELMLAGRRAIGFVEESDLTGY